MNSITLIYGIAAVLCSFLLSYLFTPAVRVLSYKLNAVDIPKDNRRMHNKPMPLIGGLAIFLSFMITTLIFTDVSAEMTALWVGGLILIILGILDDIYNINAWIKLAVQIIVALVVIYEKLLISSIYLFDRYIEFGWLSYPITIFWVVALINAFNLIDGLDGLSCGVCSICCISLFLVAIMMGDTTQALLAIILFGSCVGFLPYNFNPAKIFMGDTGAYFLGFVLAVVSIQGVFKMSAVISFILPVIIFALPLFDTIFAFCRRILNGQGPFTPDKRHLHHRLMACGLSQRRTVSILYAISGLFGLIAIIYTDILFSDKKLYKALILVAAAAIIFILDYILLLNKKTRYHTGLVSEETEKSKDDINKSTIKKTEASGTDTVADVKKDTDNKAEDKNQ